MDKPPFRDRSDAGRKLAQALPDLRAHNPFVMAVTRGGVPVAVEVARALQAPLDLVIVRRIVVPAHPDRTIGAVLDADEPETFLDEDLVKTLDIPPQSIEDEIVRQRQVIAFQQNLYASGRPRLGVRRRAVILVDDLVATGATVRVAIRALYDASASPVIVASPVVAAPAAEAVKAACDDLVALAIVPDAAEAARCYADFYPVSDSEVVRLMHEMPAPFLSD